MATSDNSPAAVRPWVAVLWLLTLVTRGGHGYPGGSPDIACAAMLPTGHGSNPQASRPPYRIFASKDSYRPGETLQVIVQAEGENYFRGLLLQPRMTGCNVNRTRLIGVFTNRDSDLETKHCLGKVNSAISHTSARKKRLKTFHWTAPVTASGHVVMRATFVRNLRQYWTHVESHIVRDLNSNDQDLQGCTSAGPPAWHPGPLRPTVSPGTRGSAGVHTSPFPGPGLSTPSARPGLGADVLLHGWKASSDQTKASAESETRPKGLLPPWLGSARQSNRPTSEGTTARYKGNSSFNTHVPETENSTAGNNGNEHSHMTGNATAENKGRSVFNTTMKTTARTKGGLLVVHSNPGLVLTPTSPSPSSEAVTTRWAYTKVTLLLMMSSVWSIASF